MGKIEVVVGSIQENAMIGKGKVSPTLTAAMGLGGGGYDTNGYLKERTNKELVLGIIDPKGYEHANRVYSIKGIVPTLSARDWKDPIKIVDKVKETNIMAESRAEQSRAEQSIIAA